MKLHVIRRTCAAVQVLRLNKKYSMLIFSVQKLDSQCDMGAIVFTCEISNSFQLFENEILAYANTHKYRDILVKQLVSRE